MIQPPMVSKFRNKLDIAKQQAHHQSQFKGGGGDEEEPRESYGRAKLA